MERMSKNMENNKINTELKNQRPTTAVQSNTSQADRRV